MRTLTSCLGRSPSDTTLGAGTILLHLQVSATRTDLVEISVWVDDCPCASVSAASDPVRESAAAHSRHSNDHPVSCILFHHAGKQFFTEMGIALRRKAPALMAVLTSRPLVFSLGSSLAAGTYPAFVGFICLDTDSTMPISANWMERAVPP